MSRRQAIMAPVTIKRQRVFVCRSLSELSSVPAPTDVEVRNVTAENVGMAQALRGAQVAAKFARFLTEGQIGVYAVHAGRVVGHGWLILCAVNAQVANRYFALRPAQALIHFCYVEESMRGRNVFPAMLRELARHAFAGPIQELFVDTGTKNQSSIRGIVKAGFRPAGYLTCVLLFGVSVYSRYSSVQNEADLCPLT